MSHGPTHTQGPSIRTDLDVVGIDEGHGRVADARNGLEASGQIHDVLFYQRHVAHIQQALLPSRGELLADETDDQGGTRLGWEHLQAVVRHVTHQRHIGEEFTVVM